MFGVACADSDRIYPFGTGFKELFGLTSIGLTDGVETLTEEEGKAVALRLKDEPLSSLFLLVKRTPLENYPGTAFKEELLLITPFEGALSLFEGNLKILTGEELARSMMRCLTYSSPYRVKGKKVELPYSNIPADSLFEPPLGSFYRSVFLNEIEKRKKRGDRIAIYKGAYPVKAPEPQKLFQVPWSGILGIRFMFYSKSLERVASARGGITQSRREDRALWGDFVRKIKNAQALPVLVETTLYLDSLWGEREANAVLRGALGQEPLLWFEGYREWIENTFVAVSDDAFELFYAGDRETADSCGLYPYWKLFFKKLGKNYEVSSPQVYGINKEKNFRSYHFFKEGNIPSAGSVAPPRSGKSFYNQGIVCQFAGINPKELLEGEPEKKNLDAFVCYFDVGYSAEFLVKLLKLRGFSVEVVIPDESIRINPFEVEDSYDVEVAVKVINLLFEIRGEKGLTVGEEGILRKTLSFFAEDRSFLDYYQLNILYHEAEYRPLYERALELGYDPFTPFSKLKEKEFDFLKHPTVNTVLKFLESLRGVSKSDVEAIDGLVKKLEEIRKIPNFSGWSTFSFKRREFIYFELSKIKESTLFAPLYLLIFTRALKEMRKVSPEKPKLFVNDEFHNITRYSQFKTLFEVLLREAPKFNIYTFLITQEPNDLKELVNLLGTKILFKPAPEVEGAVGEETTFEIQAREVFNLSEGAYRELRNLPKYTPLVVSASGYFTLSLPVGEAEKLVFESRKHTEIYTKDGHRIVKSYREESND